MYCSICDILLLLSWTQSSAWFSLIRSTWAVMRKWEKKRCEDGFQEARGEKGSRKGETGSRQTSEGKQKLMKQDVATDGSLHTSKHGTLAGPLQTLPPFFSSWRNQKQDYTSQPLLFSRYSKSPQWLLIGPLISIYTFVYISRLIELGCYEPGWGTSNTAQRHKLAQIRWIQLGVFTLFRHKELILSLITARAKIGATA